MARLYRLLSLFVLAVSVTSLPAPDTYTLHEKREQPLRQWVKRSRVDSGLILPVRIGLTQSNLDKGPELLYEVSGPESFKYSQHYTAEQIHDIFAPSQESVDGVKAWLDRSGIHPERVSQSVNKQWLQFDAETGEVESLLRTEYHHFEHLRTGKSNVGTDEYHIPEYLREHIDYITPGLKLLVPSHKKTEDREAIQKRTFGVTSPGTPTLPPLKKALSQPLSSLLKLGLAALCQVAIVPQCISTLYNITAPTKAAPGNQLGIFEDLNDKYSQTDLNDFFLTLAPQIPQGTHPTLDGIDGATAPVVSEVISGISKKNLSMSINIHGFDIRCDFCLNAINLFCSRLALSTADNYRRRLRQLVQNQTWTFRSRIR